MQVVRSQIGCLGLKEEIKKSKKEAVKEFIVVSSF
jgi:hypothetical protein